MADAAKVNWSKTDQESFENLSHLLHLFFYRNKNQHRRSIWWRHFSTFRRQLQKLLQDIRLINEVPTTHLERMRKRSKDLEIQVSISRRLEFWQTALVAKWHHAFTQLIADARFAQLGLVLLATLAQTCRITSVIAGLEDMGEAEMEKVLYQFAAEERVDEIEQTGKELGNEEDIGEVVARDHIDLDEPASRTLAKISTPMKQRQGCSMNASRPKRRKM